MKVQGNNETIGQQRETDSERERGGGRERDKEAFSSQVSTKEEKTKNKDLVSW